MVETAKTVIVEWSPELKEVIERARNLGPHIRKTLICNLQGKPFTESGSGRTGIGSCKWA
jgi:hypothetical protein